MIMKIQSTFSHWFFTFIFIITSQAATFYVAINGDDSRTPSQAQKSTTPWQSIQKAVNQANAGDIVKVGTGTYYGGINLKDKNGGKKYIKFMPSNTKKPKPIIIANSGTTVDNSGESGAFLLDHCNNIEINGFEVSAPGIYGCGINITNYSHHIRVINCIARDSGQSGIGTAFCDYITIHNCDIYRNCGIGIYQGSGISLWKNWWSNSASTYHNIITNNRISYNIATFTGLSGQNDEYHTDGNGIIIDTSKDFDATALANGNYSWSQYSPKTLIQSNQIHHNGGRGVHVFESDSVDIIKNYIGYNLQDPSPNIRPGGGEGNAFRAHDVKFTKNTIDQFHSAAFVLTGDVPSTVSYRCYEYENIINKR
jgi:Right handed beta helix region